MNHRSEIDSILKIEVDRVYNYTVLLEPELDGGYHAFCPILKGCHSQGDTFEEAIENIKEAIELALESLIADDLPIPKENLIVKPWRRSICIDCYCFIETILDSDCPKTRKIRSHARTIKAMLDCHFFSIITISIEPKI